MNEKQAQQWAKWHARGKRMYMLTNIGLVALFYGVAGTFAYVHLYRTMPDAVHARGGGLPLLPALLVVGLMLPLAVLLSHFIWHRNEKKYAEYVKERRAEE